VYEDEPVIALRVCHVEAPDSWYWSTTLVTVEDDVTVAVRGSGEPLAANTGPLRMHANGHPPWAFVDDGAGTDSVTEGPGGSDPLAGTAARSIRFANTLISGAGAGVPGAGAVGEPATPPTGLGSGLAAVTATAPTVAINGFSGPTTGPGELDGVGDTAATAVAVGTAIVTDGPLPGPTEPATGIAPVGVETDVTVVAGALLVSGGGCIGTAAGRATAAASRARAGGEIRMRPGAAMPGRGPAEI
jgi:hypothetical protein